MDIKDKKVLQGLKKANDEYYDIQSPHYKNNERYSWIVNKINTDMNENNKHQNEIAKTRILQSYSMVEYKQISFPSFRNYNLLRKFKCYRKIRASYLKYLRNKYKRDTKNWKIVPMQTGVRLSNGSMVVHPDLYMKMKNSEKIY